MVQCSNQIVPTKNKFHEAESQYLKLFYTRAFLLQIFKSLTTLSTDSAQSVRKLHITNVNDNYKCFKMDFIFAIDFEQ